MTAAACYVVFGVIFNLWGGNRFSGDPSTSSEQLYLSLITLSFAILLIAYFLKRYILALCYTWISRRTHSKMIFSILHAKVTEFLQRIPQGSIINRFSNDIHQIDKEFSTVYDGFISAVLGFFFPMMFLIFNSPSKLILIPFVIYMLVSIWVRHRYMAANREISRLVLISQSPVVGLATSSIDGGPIIRSLNRQEYIKKSLNEHIDNNSKNFVLKFGLTGWFNDVILGINCVFLYLPILASIAYGSYTTTTLKAAQTANFFSQSISVSSDFITALNLINVVSLTALSFERCFDYQDIEPEEGYLNIEETKHFFYTLNKRTLIRGRQFISSYQKPDFFKKGEIVFKGVAARYPTNSHPVLKDTNLSIEAGQKVGIVGRSGAGKSTFTKLLWRALEPCKGTIEVDGIKIRELDVKQYREQLNIILQKPNIFEGTLASNISSRTLDDGEIREVIEDLEEMGFPKSKLMDRKLQFEVQQNGNNLSLSEKQMVCLMHSLLKPTKIGILDEATAYIDVTLERKFQKKIKEVFADCTMFVIAHRISSVMDCDRILVFDKGRVVEDGRPQELVKDKTTHFYDMWSKE